MKTLHTLALLAGLAWLFASCKKDLPDFPENPQTPADQKLSQEEIDKINEDICLAVDPVNYAEDRATGIKDKFWPKGATLRVKFLNGSHSLRHKVFDYAKTWSKYANITFQKVDTGQSEIRVLFTAEQASDSWLGTDNLDISQNDPTMHLHINDFSTETRIRRHSLHEFGHAVGLMHEHQNPLANIPWNVPKVYAYFDSTTELTHTDVNENILDNPGWGPAQHTSYDPQSIMLYYFPSELMLTNDGFTFAYNTELSAKDKDFISKIYGPKRIHICHDANIPGTITFELDGIYTTLEKGEGLFVPVDPLNGKLHLWECPNDCQWSTYDVLLNSWYKIVSDPDNPNDLMLEQDIFGCGEKH